MWIHPIYERIEPAGEPPITRTGDGLTMAEYAIETIGLGRRFGRIEALADVSLTVPTGELVGLIGPNGAGKTTLIMLLLGILRPSNGKALVLGADATYEFSRVGSAVGVVLDVHGLYEGLTALQNLLFFGELFGLSREAASQRASELLRTAGLWNRRHDRVAAYSKGMKQRLAIARSLMHHPRLLIMDEPVSGLDPESRRATKDLIKHLTQNQIVTVLLSSHSLADIEELCSKVAILSKGRLVAYDTVSSLRQSRDVSFIRITLARGQGRASVDTVLASIKGVAEYSWIAEDTVQVAMARGVGSSEVLRRLALGSVEFREVREMGNTLEDVFLSAVEEEEEANQG